MDRALPETPPAAVDLPPGGSSSLLTPKTISDGRILLPAMTRQRLIRDRRLPPVSESYMGANPLSSFLPPICAKSRLPTAPAQISRPASVNSVVIASSCRPASRYRSTAGDRQQRRGDHDTVDARRAGYLCGAVGAREFAHYWRGRKIDSGLLPMSRFETGKGVDPGCMPAWRSLQAAICGRFEIVFGVSRLDDPAVEEIERLRRSFRSARSIWLVSRTAGDVGKVSICTGAA